MSATYRCRASISFAGVLRLAVSIGVDVERPAEVCDHAEGGRPRLGRSEAAERERDDRVGTENKPTGFQCDAISENPSPSSR